MQTMWRILQAISKVAQKREELARKRRVVNRLYGKAEERRSQRLLGGWKQYVKPRAEAKRMARVLDVKWRKRVLGSWFKYTKAGPSRRKTLIRRLQKVVRGKIAGSDHATWEPAATSRHASGLAGAHIKSTPKVF